MAKKQQHPSSGVGTDGFLNQQDLQGVTALYGLPHSGRCFHEHLQDTLKKLGWKRHLSEKRVFTRIGPNGVREFLMVFVDDIVLAIYCQLRARIVWEELRTVYTLKVLGPMRSFLGVNYELI